MVNLRYLFANLDTATIEELKQAQQQIYDMRESAAALAHVIDEKLIKAQIDKLLDVCESAFGQEIVAEGQNEYVQ